MNKRIRELIVSLEPDAFMTYKGYLYHSGDPKVLEHSDPEPLYTQQELVKFAELIVGKCIAQCEQFLDDPDFTIGAMRCAIQLNQYFGVEE